jgi:hypothetical protein
MARKPLQNKSLEIFGEMDSGVWRGRFKPRIKPWAGTGNLIQGAPRFDRGGTSVSYTRSTTEI